MKNNKYEKIISVKSYSNIYLEKKEIYKENNNKRGIYKWTHKKSGKSYVGSSIILSRRLGCYFCKSFLEGEVKKNNSLIYKALLKDGYSSFTLDILEYVASDDKKQLIKKEQYYIDLIKPEYNILRTAGSSLGFKHSISSKERMAKEKLGK